MVDSSDRLIARPTGEPWEETMRRVSTAFHRTNPEVERAYRRGYRDGFWEGADAMSGMACGHAQALLDTIPPSRENGEKRHLLTTILRTARQQMDRCERFGKERLAAWCATDAHRRTYPPHFPSP